jgi:uncharacterized RDD family membrane protein YckC
MPLTAVADLPLGDGVPAAVPPPVRFDDTPPPARAPLSVRRTAERPRTRPTTQVVRRTPTSLLDVVPPADPPPGPGAATTSVDAATLAARVAAGVIDLALLAAIALSVVYFTVRLSGLSMAELRLVPPVPLGVFLLGQAVAYLTAFTACGGQTLGKMAMGVRVIGDDGAVPAGAAMIRACTALAGAALAGVGYLPALFDADHRGVHDRLAGTRVVRA